MERIYALFACISLVGCSAFSTPSHSGVMEDLSMHTLENVYQIGEDGITEISATFHNESEKTYYLKGCSVGLEKLVEGEWILAYTTTCVQLTPTASPFAAGRTVPVKLRINKAQFDNPRDDSWTPEIETLEGEYRLIESVFSSWDEEQYLKDPKAYPTDIVPSNSFTITLSN